MWYSNPQLPLFIVTVCICVVAWSSAVEAYFTGNRAEEAWQLAYRQKCRLDRMNRQANIGSKETKYVNYEEGFEVRDSWIDDFNKTQFTPMPKGWIARLFSKVRK